MNWINVLLERKSIGIEHKLNKLLTKTCFSHETWLSLVSSRTFICIYVDCRIKTMMTKHLKILKIHWILFFYSIRRKVLVWSNFEASFTGLQSDLRTQAPGFFLKHHYQLIKIRLRKNATCISPSQSSQWGMKIKLLLSSLQCILCCLKLRV